jgi:hypothetical protein
MDIENLIHTIKQASENLKTQYELCLRYDALKKELAEVEAQLSKFLTGVTNTPVTREIPPCKRRRLSKEWWFSWLKNHFPDISVKSGKEYTRLDIIQKLQCENIDAYKDALSHYKGLHPKQKLRDVHIVMTNMFVEYLGMTPTRKLAWGGIKGKRLIQTYALVEEEQTGEE